MASNTLFIKDYGSSDFIFTTPLLQEGLCIAVPSSLLVPSWKMVFRVYEPTVWICIGCSSLISMITWYILNVLARSNSRFVDSVFYIGRIVVSSVKLPKKAWKRIFTFSIILSSCVLSPTFEGSLLKLLKTRSYEKDIKTLREFRDSEYSIYTLSTNLIDDSLPDYLKGRVCLFQASEIGSDLVHMVGTYKNFSYLGRKCDILQRISAVRGQVNLVKECPRSYFLGYGMRKGHLLFRAVNIAVQRIMAAGLDQTPIVNLECVKHRKEKERIIPKALDLSNLMIAVYILQLGYSLAILTFMGELITVQICRIYNQRRLHINAKNII